MTAHTDKDADTDDGCHLIVVLLTGQTIQPGNQKINLLTPGSRQFLVGRCVNILCQQVNYVKVIDVCRNAVYTRDGPADKQHIRHV